MAINTLTAMTEQIRAFYPVTHTLCPMIDARRMEVYCALYRASDGTELQQTAAVIIDSQSFIEWLDQGPVVFFGDGAEKCRAIIGQHPNTVFMDQLIRPSAKTVGFLATQAFIAGHFEDVATFEPFYLKDFMTTVPRKALLH